ncbi:hypothetical protein GCM10008014_37670 [Paenibacillus silvae]|uniref:Uncharacterized protein n=1 Tax=Paenibacillus silvae TaxID=1325358 RepID=A0ABQ1ZHC1_9BACL|nr:hypothetical protein GCM10008014_37670 [Paenibacillus silvae]
MDESEIGAAAAGDTEASSSAPPRIVGITLANFIVYSSFPDQILIKSDYAYLGWLSVCIGQGGVWSLDEKRG